MSECDILNLALWAEKGPVQTGSLGVMGLVVFGTAFVYHYDDHTSQDDCTMKGGAGVTEYGPDLKKLGG